MKTPKQILDSLPPGRKRALSWVAVALAVAGAFLAGKVTTPPGKVNPSATVPAVVKVSPTRQAGVTASATARPATQTIAPATPTLALPVATNTPSPTVTSGATATLAPTGTPGATFTPWPDAPLCPDHGIDHDTGHFHTLWDSARNCHYDHEHGQDPFTPEIAAAFPGLDLKALLGGAQIGHTNPSSPAENVAKHGGFKWQVSANAPNGCAVGFESGTVAIDAYAIQYHAFGPQSIEFEARNHSAAALLRQCKNGEQGYLYTVQLQEYGERCLPYQGITLPYPDNFQPEYDCAFGPYFTTEGVGPCEGCRANLDYYDGAFNHNNLSIWTSKRTGPVSQPRPAGPTLFSLLFRSRDNYQSLDARDMLHPFTWLWACSSNGGADYDPAGCRYNNSSVTVHEVAGTVPTAWDGLAGFDSDTRAGRVTGQAFTTRFGTLVLTCSSPAMDCAPVFLREAFTGKYSTDFCAAKCSNPTPADTPERDIYFLNGRVVSETTPGAVPSGWIGAQN